MSVADAQRSLSLILAAVARKLKKAVASNDPCAIQEADQAVDRTLAEVTTLEQALHHELEQIWKICGPCCPEREEPCTSGILETICFEQL